MAQTYHRYRAGDKPVGGYKLIRKLGEGGFGEVWQASAPGGAEVALKFIDLTGQQGFREFKSLRLVKKITHTNLTPLHGFWLKNEDGTLIDESDVTWSQLAPSIPTDPGSPPAGALATAVYAHPVELIVAMGLGKKSLYDRLRECKDEGLGGIPADELLDYMEDAAKGIDYLNRPIHDMGQGPMPIVHSDIKPHNILIVGDGAQVCDFGLAHAVEALRKTCQAPLTLAYAAPESFRGKPCDKSDQYSLGISYVELRTGSLPFDENMTGFEVMTAHVQGQLDFSRLTPAEQSVVRKATSPLPQDRWRSSREMVVELRRALRLTPGTSDYVPDVRATPGVPTGPEYRGTSMPPAIPKGDTSPFLGRTPTDRDPAMRTLTPAATTSTVLSATTDRSPVKRRPMPTAAKLFISLLLLGVVGGVAGYFGFNPPGPDDPKKDVADVTPQDTDEKDVDSPEEIAAKKARDAAEAQKIRERELAAPKLAFEEHLNSGRFEEALKLLDTSPVFTETEKTANRLKLQTGWRADADEAFLDGNYERAAPAYSALAKEFSDSLPGTDLNLMQARARLGVDDLETARSVMTNLSPPAERKTARDQIFFLVKLLVADPSKSPTGIDELHRVWQEHHSNDGGSGSADATKDIWAARPFEKERLEKVQSTVVSDWLETANHRSLPQDEEGLKKLLEDVNKIVQLDDDNFHAWVIKGNIHLALQQWPELGEAVKKRLSLRRSSVQGLRDRAEVLEVSYQLNNSASDKETLDAALAKVPRLMRFKNSQLILVESVQALIQRSPQYLAAGVQTLRAAAESPDADPDLQRQYAPLLSKDIRRRLVEEPNFVAQADQLLSDCTFVKKHGVSPDEFIRACEAECLLELNQPGALQALGAPGKSPYYQYVKARVLRQTPSSAAELRNALAALFSQSPTPELRQANRIKLAFETLEQGLTLGLATGTFNIARALEPPTDLKSLEGSYDLLRNAYGWNDANTSLSDVTRAHLATAAWWHPIKKDEQLARELTAGLVAEWQKNSRDEIHNPSVVYRLYHTYLDAHRTAGDKPTQEKTLAVVDRLISLTNKKKLDDEQVQAFYRKIVAPYEPIAANLRNHVFYAHAAGLISDEAHLNWGFTDNTGKKLPVSAKLEQLYTSAINFSNGQVPEYLLSRGRVRLNRKPYSLKAVLEDASALGRFKQSQSSALTLGGQAYFYQSREETTHSRRLQALDQSIKTLRQALDTGNEQVLTNEQKAERLLVLSYVHLERRNFAGWDANAVDEFAKAADYAEKAKEFLRNSPQLEHAYSAAGNAYEDMAWYRPPQVPYEKADVEANYQNAIKSFEFAIRTNPESVAAHMNLGRCYYKMATDPLHPTAAGTTVRGMIVEAVNALKRATELAKSQSHENPQAHYWLGKVLQLKQLEEGLSVEKAKRKLSVDEFHAADDELSKALELAVQQNLSNNELGFYAIELADNVLLHPLFYQNDRAAKNKALLTVAARAEELKKYDLPKNMGINLDREVQVLNARAKFLTDSGVAALEELDAVAGDIRQSDPDIASGSDTKIMEFRFEVFADLLPNELTRERTEAWLEDAIWYAKLPPTINRRKAPISILEDARTEAEKIRSKVAGETLFTDFKAAWLQAAIESSPTDKRLLSWYTELLADFERQTRAAGNNAKELALVANRTATRLERLISFLDKRGRGGEADQLRAHAKSYRAKAGPAAAQAKAPPARGK